MAIFSAITERERKLKTGTPTRQ